MYNVNYEFVAKEWSGVWWCYCCCDCYVIYSILTKYQIHRNVNVYTVLVGFLYLYISYIHFETLLAITPSPELIQGPGVLPNMGTSLYIRDIRKLGCRK